ncbi:MAG: ABC transporter substrate-binding protein [Calditrichia bacterium]
MKTFTILISLMWIALAVQPGHSQQNDRQLFRQGVSDFENEQYDAAQETFLSILKNYPNTSLLTATKLMLAKSYYRLHDYRSAAVVSKNFLDNHPKSDYVDDIYFLQGKIAYRQENYRDAIDKWHWLMVNESDPRLRRQSAEYLYHTIYLHYPGDNLDELRGRYRDSEFSGLLEVVQARQLMEQGRDSESIRRLQQYVKQNPNQIYADIAREILELNSGAEISGNSIMVIKSTEQGVEEVSNAIATGLMYAAYEMAQRDPEKAVKVDTLNTSPGVLSTVLNTMNTLDRKLPLAVVGPPNNDESAALALLSRYQYFPFIAPTSAQTGLTRISPYVFQINPDARNKGRVLARYATQDAGHQTFAILAPADDDGENIASSFKETVEKNGGKVLSTQWYHYDTEDFSRYFKSIRDSLFISDSLIIADSTIRTAAEDTIVPGDSLKLDAIFIALYPDDISFIAPQFAFQNFECALLGNEGWNVPELLRENQSYISGLVYVTAGYFDPNSFEYKTFTSRFRQKMKTTPGMYHLLGYDVGKWMISHYQNGISREDFRDRLESSAVYQGVFGNIGFEGDTRVNDQLNIIRFYMGQIMKIQ